VTIEDTGEGMDQPVLDRIFEPYFTTREIGKGTGLGLSVVHGIIAEIEGEILVSSKKNKGSTFSVYLPVASAYLVGQKERKEKNQKLLFISGNKYETKILSLALENSGYSLLFASDINKLLTIISKKDSLPDLIILVDDSEEISYDDIINIYSSGEISIPVILISDRFQLQIAEKILNSGIVKQHLTKPVSLKEIHNAIHISLM
jgi:two-component system, cell cycle sensor histidine kinase and response regulator CckA